MCKKKLKIIVRAKQRKKNKHKTNQNGKKGWRFDNKTKILNYRVRGKQRK